MRVFVGSYFAEDKPDQKSIWGFFLKAFFSNIHMDFKTRPAANLSVSVVEYRAIFLTPKKIVRVKLVPHKAGIKIEVSTPVSLNNQTLKDLINVEQFAQAKTKHVNF